MYRVLSSCHGDPLKNLRELTWGDPNSGDPVEVTPVEQSVHTQVA